jgi:hypothetical protein
MALPRFGSPSPIPSFNREFWRLRLPVLASIGVFIALFVWGRHHFGHLYQLWLILRIPALNQSFADTRTITHSINCLLAGGNPYVDRAFDPWHRVYNYPPLWLGLRYLGIRSTSTNWIGSLLAAAGLSACVALFRARTHTAAILVVLSMWCWPLLFAMERGNTDLVIFALLVFGILLIGPVRARSTTLLRCLLIVLLTVLKIYPVAAVVGLLRNRRAVLTASATALIAAAALVVTCGHDLHYILANTPKVTLTSFGSFPFLVALGSHWNPHLEQTLTQHDAWASLFALLAGTTAIVVGALGRSRLRSILPDIDIDSSRGFLALGGIAIYCLIFTRGAGYNYWLIFLLAPMMYLIEDLNHPQSRRSLPAALVLLAFLLSPYLDHPLIQELLDGVVFLGACIWIGATLMNHLHSANEASTRSTFAELTT